MSLLKDALRQQLQFWSTRKEEVVLLTEELAALVLQLLHPAHRYRVLVGWLSFFLLSLSLSLSLS